MYWIEYYNRSPESRDSVGTAVEALGDRAVIIVDGRESCNTHHKIAREEGRKRGFWGYKICKGDAFTRPDKKTGLHMVGLAPPQPV